MTEKQIETSLPRESVWDYPRPPAVQDVPQRVRIVLNGTTIADTLRAVRVLETSHPPTYYLHPDDIAHEYLQSIPRKSVCEWKGQASYYNVVMGDRLIEKAAWYYPNPVPGFEKIAGHVAFYAGPMDACYVGVEKVTPQPGGSYGGWITANLEGPFKGGPGTWGW
jgi:uncharacterized protein (DUF427 family)